MNCLQAEIAPRLPDSHISAPVPKKLKRRPIETMLQPLGKRREVGNKDHAFDRGDYPSASEKELHLLSQLRAVRRGSRTADMAEPACTFGEKVADKVAATMGSWPFILVQTVLLAVWIMLNITSFMRQWDPYPFILLNLALSFQAAYAAPFIMMSQNRQAKIDRAAAQTDYSINAKAELEIELLHQKLDLLRQTEVLELVQVIRRLEARIPRPHYSLAGPAAP